MRAAHYASQQGRGAAFVLAAGRLAFCGGFDLDDPELLAEAAQGPLPVLTGRYRLGDVRHITASSQRAADELDWRARIPLEQGLAELAELDEVSMQLSYWHGQEDEKTEVGES